MSKVPSALFRDAVSPIADSTAHRTSPYLPASLTPIARCLNRAVSTVLVYFGGWLTVGGGFSSLARRLGRKGFGEETGEREGKEAFEAGICAEGGALFGGIAVGGRGYA